MGRFRASRRRSGSSSSSEDGSRNSNSSRSKRIEEAVLVYHESARSIVFRDHLRRVVTRGNNESLKEGRPEPHTVSEDVSHLTQDLLDLDDSDTATDVAQISGFQPKIVPLPALELEPSDIFEPLLDSNPCETLSEAEMDVCKMLENQRCVVKTIKNVDCAAFFQRFHQSDCPRSTAPGRHNDMPPDGDCHFSSFVTSTSLLPPSGHRMRCFGKPALYSTGVVFALPSEYADPVSEDEAAERTQTWAWPAGYSAKTEFNIDGRGRLINGRQEALVPLSVLRQYNDDYLNKEEYVVANRLVKGLSQIPYNEVFLRVGGFGRLVAECDVSTGDYRTRSFDRGVGLPVALFVRTATYAHLISMLRTRARMMHILGEKHVKGIPLLMITPENGVRVLTDSLQRNLWKVASSKLSPFQNSSISHKTTISNTDEGSFQEKVDELIDLDDDIRETLTPEELARLAGGFGATDDSVATVLKQVMIQDMKLNRQAEGVNSHKLQDVVNEGLAAAVRSGDYHTSRQLLMLYSLVASQSDNIDSGHCESESEDDSDRSGKYRAMSTEGGDGHKKKEFDLVKAHQCGTLSQSLAPPPPPPLDTDRLRSATNSDGLLAVLGAAEVLKAMQTGSAKKRAHEVVSALEEWVKHGEESVAFRISSWYDQRAAQGDLKIATEGDSKFMAFVSNKAISNRKNFATHMQTAVENTNFTDIRFLMAISEILSQMHSPCLRLELLQYVLGLDNRYSVAHVLRSVELAATCLGISASSANY